MRQLNIKRWAKRALALCVLIPILAVCIVVMVRGYAAVQANAKIYTLEKVPSRPVGIVFGAEVYTNGNLSEMLADRVKMGAELYQHGKIGALLFTGDNHIKAYDEPEAMRDYAIQLGVPANAIVLDYAGFRTYDSCYRARDIFKVSQAILVTQAFHLDRALLICNALGIDLIGVAADAVDADGYLGKDLLRSQLREFPSTMLAVIDLLRNAQPTFLGDPLPILAKAP